MEMITIKASAFVMLGDVAKVENKIKPSKARYDCISTTEDYEGFAPFTNSKGMTFLSLRENNNSPKAPMYNLNSHGLNFTGLFATKKKNLFFGYPNNKDTLQNGKPNPAYPYRHDLYLIEFSENWKTFKLYVFIGGKPNHGEIIDKYIKGLYNKKIEFLETKKTPMYNYIGI